MLHVVSALLQTIVDPQNHEEIPEFIFSRFFFAGTANLFKHKLYLSSGKISSSFSTILFSKEGLFDNWFKLLFISSKFLTKRNLTSFGSKFSSASLNCSSFCYIDNSVLAFKTIGFGGNFF